jgi:uncharacterized small protein (DUF1192 family)
MKKILFIFSLFLFFAPLSIGAQTTVSKEAVSKSKKTKKPKKQKSKVTPIQIEHESDIQYVLGKPKAIVDEPDTPIMKLNLIDSTVSNYKGVSTIYRFQKVCQECFNIREMPIDPLTSDSTAIRIRRITLQYDMYEYDNAKWVKYKRLSDNSDPKIQALQKEIATKQEELKRVKAELASKKN